MRVNETEMAGKIRDVSADYSNRSVYTAVADSFDTAVSKV